MNQSQQIAALAILGLLTVVDAAQGEGFKPVLYEGGASSIRMSVIGTYRGGFYSTVATETPPAYDPETKRLYVFSYPHRAIEILDLAHPYFPRKIGAITDPSGRLGRPSSLVMDRGLLAMSFVDPDDVKPGRVAFADRDGNISKVVEVGAEPSMLTFTPDGRHVVVANLGEANADYSVDPEGSISIITLNRRDLGIEPTVVTADFRAFNGKADALRQAGVRLYGPREPTVAQDLEPESVTVSHDSRRAWVTLARNNALATVDLDQGRIADIASFGVKDNGKPGNGLDASDQDGKINIATWPLRSLYEPDGFIAYQAFGRTYLVMTNEGEPRDAVPPAAGFAGWTEEARVKEVPLDPVAFPDRATLQQDANLGRLKVSIVDGDPDGDGDLDRLHAFGGRSFSIRRPDGALVFDSGDEFERIIAAALPGFFNASNDSNRFDDRSDDRGPEPEPLALGRIGDRRYAFIGFERIGGVVAYDITCPQAPRFQLYINNRNFALDPAQVCAKDQPQSEDCRRVGDLEPEGILFIPAAQSAIGVPLLVVNHEASTSVTIFRIDAKASGQWSTCRR